MDPGANNTAVIAVSSEGMETGLRLYRSRMDCDLYIPSGLELPSDEIQGVRFYDMGIISFAKEMFRRYRSLVFIMPMGIVIRALAPLIKNKHTDPAVVTADVRGKWVVSTLSGHEGGANRLSAQVAAILRSEPVITTTKEAEKDLIAGIGARKGVLFSDVEYALETAMKKAKCTIDRLRVVSTIDVKENEKGMIDFCEAYCVCMRVFSRREIVGAKICCQESEFVKGVLGIGAVAVPCALMGGRKTELLTDRIVCRGVTIAIAQERYMW